MATKQDFILSSGIGISADKAYLVNSTNSTSSTTGSLIVNGGAGIAKSISIGGRLQLFNGSFYTSFVSSATANTVYTLPATSPAIGSSVLQATSDGVLSWVPMVASASSGGTAYSVSLNSASTNANHYLIFSPNSSGAGVALSAEPTINFNPSTKILSVSGLAITSSIGSSSYTTGALTVAGGVGIGGSVTIGSGLTGLIFARYPDGSGGAIYSTNIVPSTGNYTIYTTGNAALLNGVSAVHLSIGAQQKLSVDTNTITIRPTTGTAGTSSGALVVNGGVGIGGSVSIGSRLLLYSGANYTAFQSSASGNTVYTLPATSPAIGNSVLQSTSAGVLSWVPMVATGSAGGAGTVTQGNQYEIAYYAGTAATVIGSSTFTNNTSTGTVSITHSTASTGTTNGALVVSGGIGVGGTSYFATDVTIGNSQTGKLNFSQGTFGSAGTTTNPSLMFVGTDNNPITLSVLSDNTLSFEGSSGQLFSINNNLSSGTIFSVNDISGIPIIRANANGTLSMGEFTGSVGVGLTNPSYKLHIAGDTNLSSGYVYRINGTSVLSSTTLGTGVTNSSLTSLGTITTGVWAGTAITPYYGGTGYNSYSLGDVLVGAGSTFIRLAVGTNNYVLTADSTSPSGLSWAPTSATGLTTLNSLTSFTQYFAVGTSGSLFNISSSGQTHTFNIPMAGSGVTGLVSSQAQSFSGTKTFLNDVIIGSSTASTYFGNGALQVYGGLGVSGNLSFNRASIGYTGILTNPSIAFIGTTGAPITLSVLADNSLSFEGSSGQLFAIDNNLSTGEIFSVNDISGLPIISASAGQTVILNEFGGYTRIGSGLNSISASSGSLVVYGGVGITGNAFIGGTTNITNTTAALSTSSGALVVSGGVGIGGSLYVNSPSSISSVLINAGTVYGNLTGTATTAGFASTSSYSIQSGYATTSGLATTASYAYNAGYGLTSGFADTSSYSYISGYGLTSGLATTATYAYQSGYAITAGTSTTSYSSFLNNALANAYHPIVFTPIVGSSSGAGLSTNSLVSYNPSTNYLYTSGLAVTSGAASTSTSTGALIVTGGVGISGNLSFNSALIGTTGIASPPTMTFVGANGDPVKLRVLDDSTLAFSGSQGQLFSISPVLNAGYIFSVNDISGVPLIRANADANVTMGEFAGNIGIGLSNPAYKLHVTGAVGFTSSTASISTTSGALVVTGGVGIGGSLNVGSASLISGVAINSGTVFGNLTGLATTASYSYTSGYGITSGLATTASYSYTAGYGLTSGFADTSTYSYTSGYGITAGLANTSTYSYSSGYGITSGFANTSTYSYTSGYGITSGLATTATYSYASGFATTATSASTATTATNVINVLLTSDVTDTTRRLVYSSNGTGSTSLYNTSTLFVNPNYSSVGASVFTGLGSINIRPGIDATSGVSIGNSSGTPYVYFDTINGRIGINQPTPLYDLHIVGEISATNKSFVIDHPTKPNMTLRHGSLEGPENGVYVRGKLNNQKTITLPDYWVGLVDEDTITVSLTPIGRYSKLYVENIENYVVYINDAESNPVHCHYMVYGERKDIPKLDVEY